MTIQASVRPDYEAWHDRLGVDHLAATPWHQLVKAHLSAKGDLAGKRVLEIGCGRGGFACWLAGLDLAQEIVARAEGEVRSMAYYLWSAIRQR